jgi:hypothetical protein
MSINDNEAQNVDIPVIKALEAVGWVRRYAVVSTGI